MTALALWLAPGPVLAQDLCDAAESRIFECAVEVCTSEGAERRCLREFVGARVELILGDECDTELAQAIVSAASCADAAASLPSLEDECERAASHTQNCIEQFCLEDPANAICATLGEDYDNIEGPPCEDGMLEAAEWILEMSCVELVETWGLGR